MKKIFVSLILGMLLIAPVMVLAQNQPNTGVLPATPDKVFQVINTITNWIFAFLLFAAVLVIIIAAFIFLTSAGDPEKVAKARNYILYAIVAIVVAFLAKAIIMLVARVLGVEAGAGGFIF